MSDLIPESKATEREIPSCMEEWVYLIEEEGRTESSEIFLLK